MRSTRKSKASFALTGLLPGVLLLLAAPLFAQTAEASHAAPGIGQYDAAHEVTINGTVQQVITKRTAGSPAGMHVLVNGSNGLVNAQVGPYLTKSMRQAVHSGLPLQVVGSMVNVRGKQILLARQLIYGGQTVTIRNSRGFLLAPARSSLSPSPKKGGRPTLNGGAL